VEVLAAVGAVVVLVAAVAAAAAGSEVLEAAAVLAVAVRVAVGNAATGVKANPDSSGFAPRLARHSALPQANSLRYILLVSVEN
jgi:hypothetical protein